LPEACTLSSRRLQDPNIKRKGQQKKGWAGRKLEGCGEGGRDSHPLFSPFTAFCLRVRRKERGRILTRFKDTLVTQAGGDETRLYERRNGRGGRREGIGELISSLSLEPGRRKKGETYRESCLNRSACKGARFWDRRRLSFEERESRRSSEG